jgi:hypothetical protein
VSLEGSIAPGLDPVLSALVDGWLGGSGGAGGGSFGGGYPWRGEVCAKSVCTLEPFRRALCLAVAMGKEKKHVNLVGECGTRG